VKEWGLRWKEIDAEAVNEFRDCGGRRRVESLRGRHGRENGGHSLKNGVKWGVDTGSVLCLQFQNLEFACGDVESLIFSLDHCFQNLAQH
jgi:hypothetical protein